MPSCLNARAIFVGCSRSTASPAFGVHAMWLPRSEYREQNKPWRSPRLVSARSLPSLSTLLSPDSRRRLHWSRHRTMTIRSCDWSQSWDPPMTASIDVQHHPRQWTPWTFPSMRAPFGVLFHQTCGLQRCLNPRVAEWNLFLVVEFLDEVLHVQIEVSLPVEFQHPLHLCYWHLFRTWAVVFGGRTARRSRTCPIVYATFATACPTSLRSPPPGSS